MLAAIGFRVTALGARVAWMAQGRTNPRTHRLTLVELPESRFVADVGFGGQTPTAPLRLAPGEVANWFTGAHPRSRFVANLIAAIVRGDRRINLQNADLAIRHPDGRAEQRRLDSPADLAAVLEGTMGIALPVPAEVLWSRLPAAPVPPWP